jgi:folate-dependent phosphoribosylglycinamide formyltransferase PurN
MNMLQLGWFSSGNDEMARELLMEVWRRRARESLDLEIPFVFCNRAPGGSAATKVGAERVRFFAMVEGLGIDLITVSHVKVEPELRKRGLAETTDHSRPSPTLLEWRNAYGARVIEAIEDAGHDPHVCLLAGYMLIWSEAECQRFDAINLHPALPWGPAGTWQEVIWELMERGAEDQGAMMHLVTPELDRGPPVAYCKFPIRGAEWEPLWDHVRQRGVAAVKEEEGESNPLFRRIRAEGEKRELPLIGITVRALSSGQLRIVDKMPVTPGDPGEGAAADISEAIDLDLQGVEGRDG